MKLMHMKIPLNLFCLYWWTTGHIVKLWHYSVFVRYVEHLGCMVLSLAKKKFVLDLRHSFLVVERLPPANLCHCMPKSSGGGVYCERLSYPPSLFEDGFNYVGPRLGPETTLDNCSLMSRLLTINAYLFISRHCNIHVCASSP